MHPSYRQYGLTEADEPYVAAFESWARKQGWPREQIEAAYAWYAVQSPDTGRDMLVESFSTFSEQQGWSLGARDAALVWHGAIEDHAPEAALPETPTAVGDARSLDEIARVMRANPEAIAKAVLENQASLMQAMQAVMVADAQSESFLTRNMRPLVVAWSLFFITWIGGIAPIFGLADPTISALSRVPSELWTLMTGGIGLYMAGKTATDMTKTLKGR